MLTDINDLKPFFEDNYREIHVRGYAKEMHVSPPTASKILKRFAKKRYLDNSQEKGYSIYIASKNELFSKLAQLYWYQRFTQTGFLKQLQTHYFNNPIILFGSLAKAECKADLDIDIAIIGSTQVHDFAKYEQLLKRRIQIITFKSVEKIPVNLRNSILNGYVLSKGMFYGLE